MEMSESTAPRTYGNWRKPRSAGLYGLGSLGTKLMFGGLIFIIVTYMVTDSLIKAGVVALVLGLMMLAVITKDSHDRSVLTRATARITWWRAVRNGSHLYQSGPLGRTQWGTHQLPGLAAALRLSEHEDSYGRPFAMLFCPATATYAVGVVAEPEGSSLVDTKEVDQRVAEWGAWLASLSDEPGLEAAAVTVETAPDSGVRLRREVEGRLDPDAPAFARDVLLSAMHNYPTGSSTVRAYITLTFSAATRVDGKKRTQGEVGRDLAARLPGIVGRLNATGAGAVRPLSAQKLCEMVRVAYDPHAAQTIDDAYAADEVAALSWDEVGPAAAHATWDTYRHDGAFTVTWAMSDAPRGHVQSHILGRLLNPHPDIARKRVTLLYRPIDSANAAGLVEADANAASFRVTGAAKPSARDSLALKYALATASEEASGAGLVNFGMLVSATVLDESLVKQARATVDSLAASSRIRLRTVYGAQDSAFAAGLPLGLILPRHLRVPSTLQERL